MKRATIIYIAMILVLAASAASAASAESADSANRRYRISLSSGITIYRDGLKYDLGPDGSAGLDIGAVLSNRITLGVAVGVDQLELGYERTPPQLEAALRDKFWRYTGSAFLEYAFRMGDVEPFVGGHVGIHGVRYSYSSHYDNYGGTWGHGLGYGFLVGARMNVSPRVDVLVKIDAGHASSILDSWYYRTHVGLAWRI